LSRPERDREPGREPVDPEQPSTDEQAPAGTTGPQPWFDRPAATTLAAVAVGGAVGTVARFALEEAFPPHPGGFPWATFAINVTGAFLLGLLLIGVLGRIPHRPLLRPLLATGVIGAFTTFSTLAVELVVLGKDGHVPMAFAYAAASIGAGLLAAWCGMAIGRRMTPPALQVA